VVREERRAAADVCPFAKCFLFFSSLFFFFSFFDLRHGLHAAYPTSLPIRGERESILSFRIPSTWEALPCPELDGGPRVSRDESKLRADGLQWRSPAPTIG